MPKLSRRHIETLALAMIAFAAVIPLRAYVEHRGLFAAEMLTVFALAIIAAVDLPRGSATFDRIGKLSAWLLPLVPIGFGLAARRFATPVAFEMTALTVFGAASIALASAEGSRRLAALSLVSGGFLVLFCASISDSRYAIAVPVVWMLGCVWHLVANHWDRLDMAMPDSVVRTWTLKPTTIIATALVLGVGAYAVKDRFGPSQELLFGVMPTSGGSQWSDPAARRGVGSGDAAVAAKDHAESFGAVDSDMFLESKESSLFDMFNDMIGEPLKKKNKWERAQAMGNENFIPSHERAAKSEQGAGSFSTERMSPKEHHHFKDEIGTSVVQWDGPTGIRLAMQRYDTYDGIEWSQSADLSKEKLTRVDIDEAVWFFDPVMRKVLSRQPGLASVGLLKVLRLDSQRFPVPMMTAGVHIKDVDRQDFYAITEDGSFFMPGREKVPSMTVVHVASVGLMEDEILDSLSIGNHDRSPLRASDLERISAYVANWTSEVDQPHDKLQSIVNHLRTEFVLDRAGESSANTLSEFLKSRRGGDHLFATTAALMADQIGLSSRLVTGFYVRPDSFEIAAGHASVQPQDVHVWAEVRLDDGRWFEIEPTPTYMQPNYQPSWRLLARRFAVAFWPFIVGGMLASTLVILSRRLWIDWLLSAIWRLARWLRPRRRFRLAIFIIELRARLAGQRRPVGKSQRAWLEQLTSADGKIANEARQFSDAADAMFFGRSSETPHQNVTDLVDLLRVRTIHALNNKATS